MGRSQHSEMVKDMEKYGQQMPGFDSLDSKDLVEIIRNSTDQKEIDTAKEMLFIKNARCIITVINRFRYERWMLPYYEIDDYIQESYLLMEKILPKYDPDKSKFFSFLKTNLYYELINFRTDKHFHDEDDEHKVSVRTKKKYSQAYKEYGKCIKKGITNEEEIFKVIAKNMKCKPDTAKDYYLNAINPALRPLTIDFEERAPGAQAGIDRIYANEIPSETSIDPLRKMELNNAIEEIRKSDPDALKNTKREEIFDKYLSTYL